MTRPSLIAWRSTDMRFLPLLAVLATMLAVLIVVLYVVFTVVRVEGYSMAPALHPDDRVLSTRGHDAPAVGDVVLLHVPGVPGSMIKRVVAVSGDEIEVLGDVIYVNGELSDVAPTAYIDTDARGRMKLTVPADAVFVLGDNRPEALDSRHFGPVPMDAIEGNVIGIILPLTRAGALD